MMSMSHQKVQTSIDREVKEIRQVRESPKA